MSSRRLISTGSPFEAAAGYSRAVAAGPWCFVAGTTGYDYASMTMPEAVEAQTQNALETIRRALAEAGFAVEDIVRVHYYVTERADAAKVFSVAGPFFAAIRPAATIVTCGLLDPAMKVEIEATAFRP
jgi:enamine deaminase RidA (YjgF/YER057c/UK114 family)